VDVKHGERCAWRAEHVLPEPDSSGRPEVSKVEDGYAEAPAVHDGEHLRLPEAEPRRGVTQRERDCCLQHPSDGYDVFFLHNTTTKEFFGWLKFFFANVTESLEANPSARTILTSDCCHSGTI
jgi:hypothetical protein